MIHHLLALIQVAMGNRAEMPTPLSAEEWYAVRVLSEKHRMLAIAFKGSRKLPAHQQPPSPIMIEWALQAELIEKANERRDYLCRKAFAQLSEAGMTSVVLKGQANCMNYPDELSSFRLPGDLDLWVGTKEMMENVVGYVFRYTKPKEGIRYNHVDFPILADVPIELHYRPIFVCNPIYNQRIQRWLEEQWKRPCCEDYHGFYVADNRFNVVYQLLHMFRHLFEEGICMRQLIDYIYVLKHRPSELSDNEIMTLVQSFGLERFAHAMMFAVLQIDPTLNVYCSPDAKEGGFLWKEILEMRRCKSKTRNDLHQLTHYPHEAICEPFFRLWHAFWRLYTRLLLKRL